MLVCTDETTELVASGDPYLSFYMPFSMSVSGCYSSLNSQAIGGGGLIWHIEEDSVTRVTETITAGTSYADDSTSWTPSKNDRIDVYIDAVGSTFGGAGLKITLLGIKT